MMLKSNVFVFSKLDHTQKRTLMLEIMTRGLEPVCDRKMPPYTVHSVKVSFLTFLILPLDVK
jgi:hypothetical protein